MKIRLSSSWTKYYLIGPLTLGIIVLLIDILAGKDNLTYLLPIMLISTSAVINIFLVEAYIDNEFLYLKNFLFNRTYKIQQIDKVGELSRGLTIINTHENTKLLNTFLIINPGEFVDEFDGGKEIDVYSFLIKRINTSHKNTEHP